MSRSTVHFADSSPGSHNNSNNNRKRHNNKDKDDDDDEMAAADMANAEMDKDPHNYYKLTDLMRAAKNVHEDPAMVVELLELHQGEKHREMLFATDVKGRTALDWARMANNTFAVAVLQKAMDAYIYNKRLVAIDAAILSKPPTAVVNRRQTKELFDALRRRDGAAALRVLYENKLFRQEVNSFQEEYFIDCQDQFGFTPLLLAAGMNMIDVVSKLIDLDVEIDHKNRFGHTALTWACSTGHAEIVRILLFNGANIHHRTNEGRTGLHYACLYTKSAVANVLLKYFLERFAIHQMKAHYQTFDKSRFTHYAQLMEDFINVSECLWIAVSILACVLKLCNCCF
jgi:ankyrin repeat protein